MKFDLKKNAASAPGGGRPVPPPPGGKRYALEFSRTGLIGFVAVTLLGLVWVFIFGVLVGRGYRPETAVPELARIMPAEQNASKVLADQGVLPPEELEFYDALKKGSNVSPHLPSEQVAGGAANGGTADGMHPSFEDEDLPPAEVVQNLAKASTVNPASAPAASAKHQPAPQQPPAKPTPPKPAPSAPPAAQPPLSDDETGPPGQRYAYVYQAAAFSEAAKADAFKSKMHGLNLKASVQKVEDNGKTWHRVMVHFEGSPEDTRALKEKLRQAGIEKALLRSKKPI
ncbi:SPOR domain-containing protein [Megalodesulfovibrio gigas]|uniref:Putative Sporulation domain-containing protein n=1 Tax=Megalodesulfovibrio gigas (strain ATCC 19364 / DSM 1382 / NCIMB 9332 / VKM B-1759) TaxID=1121448 RepID=T2GDW5_MEGG1|nr:SPOR domain-containing protein [Megalodesulfovibrio gigas]AGW14072.1 putative Sporulation domain-containing protein [Megalodesulfovibrio gigas DSM 1382 = ATCC 19364]